MKRKRSLKLKLLSMFLVSLIISLLLSFGLHMVFFQPFYLNHYEIRLMEIFVQIEENLESEDFLDLIMELDYTQQVDIIIADEKLRYALRSHNQTVETERRLEPDFHNLITKEATTLEKSHISVETTGDDSPPRLVFIKKLYDGRYCILTHPWEPLVSNMKATTDFHFLVGGVASLMGVLSTLFFSKQFTKPIIEICKATEGLAELDFQQKITYESQDELGHLAKNINVLSHKLEENRKALKNEIDFQKVLSQNMSHELKTPISVMKGYLEGVVHGIADTEETREEYLHIVLDECDRMTCLIDRMLHLSKLTSFQETGLAISPFSSTLFVKNIQLHCSGLLQKHHLILEEGVESMQCMGNQELLIQGFGNFLSNAIKYGDLQTLNIILEEKGEWQYFHLYNSGTLVAEEELERIFNVFYMVDKARSRSNNSHGLGLAVTKTIAQLHQGEAYCTRGEGGMIFTMKIPKVPR